MEAAGCRVGGVQLNAQRRSWAFSGDLENPHQTYPTAYPLSAPGSDRKDEPGSSRSLPFSQKIMKVAAT